MEKTDLKKTYKKLYSPSKEDFSILEIPPLQYLMIDGDGDPNSAPEYVDAVQTLYGLSYTLKFHLKKTEGVDYTVMGLEGLWWTPDITKFSMEHKSDWDWTMMILQPDFITPPLFEEARRQSIAKGKAPLASTARLETFSEGLCVQILYLGAYDDEPPTISRMHQFIKDQGLSMNGKHHEIYLSDPRRVAPDKNRTILRQPVKKG
ncbi:MAG: GyrI-like domain-containing protein [Chloroflexi bacterium]|nr:GyrI-like domain-containing protein [Chloroflexota bacterium]